ncbi:metallophosphoesterase family protein [Bordetella genomosp. 12]|uniref:Metallo-phosphoesterase n=1 Tax=Bordetella genomosp. 12 TaxID=463035 RepID=A0A261VIS3_9BORD|nr:metallophosphoesterase [Bordetella genomosp. 12]OZI74044.1 metallo-phosphoesterase [Bordetella genomosp. 12]
MTRVLHISDTHFGTVHESTERALQDMVQTTRPDLVLIGGDITQRARKGQFAAARRFVQSLQRPVLAVPGNHDIPLFNLAARLFNPYGNYRQALGVNLEPVFEDDRLLVIGVNSTHPARRKDGRVSPRQAQRVVQRLHAARPGQLRIVLLHHPVRAVEESDTANLLIGREFAVPAWVDAGADLILGGHIHLPYVVPLAGRLGRAAWCVQAGTALSWRVRGGIPNSVNLIDRQADDSCLVRRWDFDAGLARFQEVAAHPLALSRQAAGNVAAAVAP